MDVLENGLAANPSRFGWRRCAEAEAEGNPEGIAIIQPRVGGGWGLARYRLELTKREESSKRFIHAEPSFAFVHALGP
ncbi:hypothetical protein SBV1_330006 [Verrucomicrobia bacterium]|nr:hypothetical protein SBV1_330006 [Verrucomicrobiota bacterium]